MRLGIDFGTTRTVVAYADRGNHPVVDFVDAFGDSIGFVPSVVAERAGEFRFGFDAEAVAEDPSFTILRSFKRLLSGPGAGPRDTVVVGSTTLTVSGLVASFLGYVRKALFERSNLRRKRLSDGDLSVTVGIPANAFAAQRLITLDAFREAGFTVGAMINEPSAAGFEYAHRYRTTLTSRRDLVVVYDLGGGTFDASIVRMSGRHHDVLATAGVARLGGDDFDAALADLGLRAAGIAPERLSPRAAAQWLSHCRAAKEALRPSSRKITLDLEGMLGPHALVPELTLPTSAYYEVCAPLVERSLEAISPLMARAESEASRELDEIAGVYVVGGASELPVVARLLRERFGRRLHRSPYPSGAVAIGLSIAGAEPDDFRLVDRYSRTFAVFREADDGREIVLDPIFTPDTLIPGSAVPASLSRWAPQRRTYRAAHNVGHYRFFECSEVDDRGKPKGDMSLCGDVLFPFDAPLSGEKDLSTIPIERRGEGPRIVEEYSLDDNGIVQVVIRNTDSGYERRYRLGG